jgi:hypothetical protein
MQRRQLPPADDRYRLAGDVAVSMVFTTGSGPISSLSKLGVPEESLASASLEQLDEYIRPWYESLQRHSDLFGVVLYDRLPAEFVASRTSPQVTFLKFPVGERYRLGTSILVQRYAMFARLLVQYPDLDRIWFTDINDVYFVLNPFRWLDSLPCDESHLFIGEEWTRFRENEWFAKKVRYLGGRYRELFSGALADMHLLTVGTWGASRAVALELTRAFMQEIDRLLDAGFDLTTGHGAEADMPVMNLIAYERFFERLVTFKLDVVENSVIGHQGTFLSTVENPIIHDRAKALATASPASRLQRLGAQVIRRAAEVRLESLRRSAGPRFRELRAPVQW